MGRAVRAAVERAFSRRRLMHTRLQTRLFTSRLEDSLFVCYKFLKMLKLYLVVGEHLHTIEPEDDVAIISDIEYEDTEKTINEDNLVDEDLEI